MEGPCTVRIVGPDELPECFAIRRKVFIEDQEVPESEEMDGRDTDATQFLAFAGGAPVGTARFRLIGDGEVKVERVAVLPSARSRGVGSALMEATESEAKRQGARTAVLGAQVQVIPFYEKLGYRAEGPIFLDAGIEHRHMRREL